MSEQQGQKVRVTLRWIQILDKLEPAWKEKGEFQFKATVTSNNFGGVMQETQMPEQGHYAIGDKPGWNRLEKLNKVLFDGEVVDNLTIKMTGIELDLMSADDELERYARTFEGDPASWVGHYEPADEGSTDPEAMSNWRICYDIEKL